LHRAIHELRSANYSTELGLHEWPCASCKPAPLLLLLPPCTGLHRKRRSPICHRVLFCTDRAQKTHHGQRPGTAALQRARGGRQPACGLPAARGGAPGGRHSRVRLEQPRKGCAAAKRVRDRRVRRARRRAAYGRPAANHPGRAAPRRRAGPAGAAGVDHDLLVRGTRCLRSSPWVPVPSFARVVERLCTCASGTWCRKDAGFQGRCFADTAQMNEPDADRARCAGRCGRRGAAEGAAARGVCGHQRRAGAPAHSAGSFCLHGALCAVVHSKVPRRLCSVHWYTVVPLSSCAARAACSERRCGRLEPCRPGSPLTGWQGCLRSGRGVLDPGFLHQTRCRLQTAAAHKRSRFISVQLAACEI